MGVSLCSVEQHLHMRVRFCGFRIFVVIVKGTPDEVDPLRQGKNASISRPMVSSGETNEV